MVKRRIIYESDDDDVEDRPKKPRTAPDEAPPVVTDGARTRRSERSGRGNGGRLSQMKQIERIQTERSKRPSKIDIATQGENTNPMAPSSQDVGERSRTRRDSFDEVAISRTHGQPTPAQSSLQPQFLQATTGQQFGFRVPDAASRAESDTRAPPRTRFRGASSQPSSRGSGPPSSRSTSLFSGGSLGTRSTAATSRAPSICSTTGERDLAKQRDPSSQRARSPTSSASRISATDDLPRSSQFEHSQPDAASLPNPTRLHRTTSFYGRPLSMNRSGHTLSAAPDLHDQGDMQIDEASPSEDDRIAEKALYQREDNENDPRSSPLPEYFRRTSPTPDNDDGTNGATAQHQQSQSAAYLRDDQVASQMRSQPCGDTAATHDGRDRAPGNIDRTNIDGAGPQRQPSQPVPRSSGDPAASQPSVPAQLPENIVTIHRRRNRAPRLPSNSQLLAARLQQAGSTNNATGDSEAANNGDGRECPSTNLPATERSEPWQLQYYDPPARDVIERAKQSSRCDAASIDPFPIRVAFNTKAVEYIDEAIAERRAQGLIVSDGWWPHNASSIARLLWEDLCSWRSALRKKARTFVTQRYQWDSENRRERNIEIAKSLLGNGGLFLKDGSDTEGHANNLAHPALSGLIIDFFYTSPASVGKLFPEVFAGEVPRVTVAIAATALKVVLDEIASGQGEVNFRVNIYSPVYTEILGLMSKCDTSTIHRAKTSALRRRWAQLGRQGPFHLISSFSDVMFSNGMNQEPVVGGCGFDVSLD